MRVAPYNTANIFDEMFAADGQPRPSAARFVERLESLADGTLQQRQKGSRNEPAEYGHHVQRLRT